MKKLLQAGAVPFREREGKREFLLVTSQKGNWIFPKGIVEPGEAPEETALKEAREEAGVHGLILPEPVGAYEDRKWRADCVVQLYLLRYMYDCASWEERDLRKPNGKDRRAFGLISRIFCASSGDIATGEAAGVPLAAFEPTG